MNNLARALLLASASILFCSAGHANTFTFSTPGGETNGAGEAVNASTTITTGTNSLSVSLTNNLINQKSVGQNISDLLIFLTGSPSSPTYNGTQTEPTASVASDGSFTTSTTTSFLWALSSPAAGQIYLDALGAGSCGPECTILGAPGAGGTYSNANNSITANDPHNPFIFQTLTYSLNVTGVTADTNVTGVTFSFGTAHGDNVFVPVSLAGAGLPGLVMACGGLLALARRRRQQLA